MTANHWLSEARDRSQELTYKESIGGGVVVMIKRFYVLIVVAITWIYICQKPQTIL